MPYRTSRPVYEEPESTCPYCGNACPPLTRTCPHCDVRLDRVRCATCFSLQSPGSAACGRCGSAFELEPLFDPTDAPCPRCRTPLDGSPVADEPMHECARCGGIFVGRASLERILARAEVGGPLGDIPARTAKALEHVTYVRCPLCHASMNRVSFGPASGVVVDICKAHGTWFDPGELTRVVAYVAAGGLAKARPSKAPPGTPDELRRRAEAEALMVVEAMRARREQEKELDDWTALLRALFRALFG